MDDDTRRETVDEWAARMAATLPPMTDEEIAAAGRLAAVLDARCRQPDDDHGED